jgi:hypothetical protein
MASQSRGNRGLARVLAALSLAVYAIWALNLAAGA